MSDISNPTGAATGGTIAQLRAASGSGALPGIDKPAARPAPVATPVAPVKAKAPAPVVETQSESTDSDESIAGDVDTLGHDNASEQDDTQDADLDQDAETDTDQESEGTSLDEVIHGMTARDILESIKSGEIPADLLKTLQVTARINGEDLQISVDEARRGYQRLSDYSRSKNELKEQAAQIHQFRASIDQMIDGWKDPASLRKGMAKLGLQQPLFEAAKMLAQEYMVEQSLPPGERALRAQLRQMEEENLSMKEKMELANKPSPSNRGAELTAQLQKMVPGAMKTAGITDSPAARNLFAENLKSLWEPGSDLTDQLVQEAAQATAEQLGDFAKKYASENRPAKSRVLPVRSGAAAGPDKNQQPQKRAPIQGSTVAEFKRTFSS